MVEMPLGMIFNEMSTNLVEAYAYQNGASWAGGYFVLSDIKVGPEIDMWIDVAFLASINMMNDEVITRLKELNETTDGEKCCWHTAEGEPDIL